MKSKIFRRLFRFFGIAVLVIVVIGGVAYLVLNKSLPEGKEGPEAEALTDRMLAAIQADAWEEINCIKWKFPRGHSFVWDRKKNFVEVIWGGNRVLVAPETVNGIAFVDGVQQMGEDNDALVKEGLHLFWNDSFWMNAFTRVRAPGTSRKMVDLEDEGQGLLVTYASGGSTPGDSFLWKFDAEGHPISWQMWVNIIPIGGLEFTWDNWVPLHNGALVATQHSNFLFDIPLTDIQSGDNLESIGVSADLFKVLKSNQ